MLPKNVSSEEKLDSMGSWKKNSMKEMSGLRVVIWASSVAWLPHDLEQCLASLAPNLSISK